MSGLYDVINPSAAETPKLSSHLFDAALVLYATGQFTGAAVKAALEEQIGRGFTAAENSDVNAIAAELDDKPDTTAKLLYNQQIMAAFIAAEGGQLGDSQPLLEILLGNIYQYKLDFETVEIRNPARPDGGPWIDDDPGEGPMVERQEMVLVGHKIRLGDHRQFRIVAFDGTEALVAVVGPGQEVG